MIASGRPGTTIHHVGDGADHLVAYYPFRSRPGGVVVEQTKMPRSRSPGDAATMPVYGITALIASAAAWLHATLVVADPAPHGDAARMASGDLESPIAVPVTTIGELARRFDEMRIAEGLLEESARWEELEHRVDDGRARWKTRTAS
jgi:hypothetical protein